MLARICGRAGEAGFLKRVLRTPRPRATSGALGSATCRMPLLLFSSQDGTTSQRRQTLLARDGNQKLDGNETAAFRSALGSVIEA